MKFSRLLKVTALAVPGLTAFCLPALAQTLSNIYSFTGTNGSGNPSIVVPTQGRDGKLYGTTFGPSGTAGSAFTITTGGLEQQIYSFGSDGKNPLSTLILGTDGNFYGTSSAGGATGNGVLFRLSPQGVYTSLHEFQGGTDGAVPYAPPIQASDGNFYGVTLGTEGASTVYRYSLMGSFSTIFTFQYAQGQGVFGPLLEGSDGNLYGTAEIGGTSDCGTVFKLSRSGTLLLDYSFSCIPDGQNPGGPLLQASDGNYYGTTLNGGTSRVGLGTIFKLDQSGNVSILYSFKNLADGGNPEGGLVQGTDGNLYGTTISGGKFDYGTLFQFTLNGIHTILYNFGPAGREPQAPPIQHTNGFFYGTTNLGGKYGVGTVYRLDMGLGPFVTFVLPVGKPGQQAEILGQGLTGTTTVTFNGIPATSFHIASDTAMTAQIPPGATTGPVVVTTPSAVLTSNVSFRVQ